jgi:hypothetical protein
MSEEQKQKAIEDRSRILPSGTIYVGGNVVGKTDDSGAFRVEVPGGGTYVITAGKNGAVMSRQPMVIKTGQTLELGSPIVLLPAPGPSCCSAPQPGQRRIGGVPAAR